MCTVSFIPVNGRVYITSNRDEKSRRKLATPPGFQITGNHRLLLPKDEEKGGTWIGVNANGDAAVLLNGALVPHIPDIKYTSSRGFVVPCILASSDPIATFTALDLAATEPFTLVLYHKKRLYECRWDGQLKSLSELPVTKPHIWSSATLYSLEAKNRREQWFQRWVHNHPFPGQEDIIAFHRFTGDGDIENDLVMNRKQETFTVNITSVSVGKKGAETMYIDLVQQKQYRQRLSFKKKGDTERWKRFAIRLKNWEYWPFYIVYFPILFYWLWLCIRARSFFFFNTANPTIRNGGFLMESKKDIYSLLPNSTYPATIFIPFGKINPSDLTDLLHQHDLQFPLITKPDIGLRGLGVKKINSIEELMAYHAATKVDYLVQSFISYPNEVGIFYYRLPGQKKGTVTGIVGKELLCVKGDGRNTLEELLKKADRFFLQLPALRKQYGTALSEIVPEGAVHTVAPYGNHCRGAKFVDITDKLTPALFTTINDLCKTIQGFYFGRLDIKYSNWKDLCEGRNFSIIEVNGSGSEPAHIYDPKHSLLFAWKEIILHWDILYKVSLHNKKVKRLSYLSLKEGITMLWENSEYIKKIG